MNRVRYKLVLAQITHHPKTWKQTVWHCGSQHCFAGLAQVLAGSLPRADQTYFDAKDFLALTYSEADYLFAPGRTLQELTEFFEGGGPDWVKEGTP